MVVALAMRSIIDQALECYQSQIVYRANNCCSRSFTLTMQL